METISIEYVKYTLYVYDIWISLPPDEKPYFAWLMDYLYGFYPHDCHGTCACYTDENNNG